MKKAGGLEVGCRRRFNSFTTFMKYGIAILPLGPDTWCWKLVSETDIVCSGQFYGAHDEVVNLVQSLPMFNGLQIVTYSREAWNLCQLDVTKDIGNGSDN